MFEQISSNAPQTEMSAKAQLAIGKINRSEGKLTEAILAYESVVEEYPNTKFAQEAQFNLFQLHGREADRSFSPVDLRQQKEAGEDFITQFGADPRADDIRAALGKLEDKESAKAFDIGRFYERKGNLKSAAVYYREVLRHPGSKQYDSAKKRLSALIEADPSLASIGAQVPKRTRPAPAAGSTPPAQTQTAGNPASPAAAAPPSLPRVKKTADLLGPPPPDLKTSKPKMRTSEDDVQPIPADDPGGN
jgi:tetratricopeptide (TPR) repeat protein